MESSFILHVDSLSILDKMDDEMAGQFIKALYEYQLTGKLPELNFTLDIALTPFVNQFKRDSNKYETICERNRINGSKGGRPKKETEINPKNPPGLLETQKTQMKRTKPKKAYSKSNSNSKKDNKKKIKQKDFYSEYSFFKKKFAKRWYDEFIPLKKRKKASTTERQLNSQLKKIAKLSKNNYSIAFEILNKSINSGWTDFYPLNGSNIKAKPPNTNGSHNTSLKKQKFIRAHKTV